MFSITSNVEVILNVNWMNIGQRVEGMEQIV